MIYAPIIYNVYMYYYINIYTDDSRLKGFERIVENHKMC